MTFVNATSQPTKVKPARVGSAGAVAALPWSTTWVFRIVPSQSLKVTVWVGMGATLMVISSASTAIPSETRTVTGKAPAALGVQLKAPVTGSMVAPAGGSTRLYVSVWAGRSMSVADAEKVTGEPTVPDLSPIADKTGGSLTSVTVMSTVATFESRSASFAL